MEVIMNGISRTVILSAETVCLCFLLMACSSPPSQSNAQPQAQAQAQPQAAPPEAPPVQEQQKQYDLKGKVVKVDKAEKSVAVAGEDIPGFMGAMTMSYPVKDEQLLAKLSPGDQITAKIVATGSEFWLENIAVDGKK
jgi:Cu/Ag efflux protein CusF